MDPQSSWTRGGEQLPFVKVGQPTDDSYASAHQAALDEGVPPEALIDVDEITAPVLMTCGQHDRIWPSPAAGHGRNPR